MKRKILALIILLVLFYLTFRFLDSRDSEVTDSFNKESLKTNDNTGDEINVEIKDSLLIQKDSSKNSIKKDSLVSEISGSTETKKTQKINSSKSTPKEVLNEGKVVSKEGLDKKILIYQSFKHPSTTGEYLSKVYDLKIKNPGFISFSAYTLDMSDNIRLFYRYNDGNKWTNWLELPKDTHIVNHKRNVFGLATIKDNIEKIQFKSPVAPRSEVVFNFFIPTN